MGIQMQMEMEMEMEMEESEMKCCTGKKQIKCILKNIRI
jgi:hypothetical protein